MSILNPSPLDSTRMQGAAYLLVLVAWLLTGVLNGIIYFLEGRDLGNAALTLVFNLVVGAGLFTSILAIGLKRPAISGVLLVIVAGIGMMAMPSFFLPGHIFEGQTGARVLFITHLVAVTSAGVLLLLAGRRGKAVEV